LFLPIKVFVNDTYALQKFFSGSRHVMKKSTSHATSRGQPLAAALRFRQWSWKPKVTGVTFSESASVQMFPDPGSNFFQIWESDSCSDSVNHQCHRNLACLYWSNDIYENHADYKPRRLQTTQNTNHADYKPRRLQTRQNTNHAEYKPRRLQTTQTTNHADYKPGRMQTTQNTNHADYKPRRLQTTPENKNWLWVRVRKKTAKSCQIRLQIRGHLETCVQRFAGKLCFRVRASLFY